MDPITLAAISAIPAVAQGITGLVQSHKSKKMLDGLERPTYTIPEAATQALNLAKTNASSFQMAGQDNAQQAIDQVAANSLYNINQNATSAPEALAAMAGVTANQMGSQNELAMNAATDFQRRQQDLMRGLQTYSSFQDKSWDFNKNKPFQEQAAAAAALGNAGMRNKYEGLKGLAGVAANAGMAGMFGGGTPKSTDWNGVSAEPQIKFDMNGTNPITPNTPSQSQFPSPQLKGGSLMSDAGSENFTITDNALSAEDKAKLEKLLPIMSQLGFNLGN